MKSAGRAIRQGAETLWLSLALLLVLLIAFLSYRAWSEFGRQSEQIRITQRVVEDTTALLASITDAETGQRGFLLTGRQSYLESYHNALAAVPGLLDSLAKATVDWPDQSTRLEKLKPVVREKLDELQETVELYSRRKPEAALALVLTDRGKLEMDEIRQACSELQSAAYDRLSRQTAQSFSGANRIGFVGTAGSAALFALLTLFAITNQRGSRRRQELIQDLHKSEEQSRVAHEWLQTIIGSIGDGVVATDASGKVILLNAVAESLTGWTLQQASGLPLGQVLVISDEETGQGAEDPVARVLREGRMVGFTNHTNLTSREGRLISIEDSAAPIRDASNQIAGVVLVFRDVSQRRAAEQREKDNAIGLGRLAAIVESSDDAIISKDLNGMITSWNRGAERIFGYSKEEVVGRSIAILASPGHEDEMASILEQIARGEHIEHFETMRRTKDGRDIYISLTVSPIRDSNGVIVGASKISRNITERVMAEKEHRKQAELIARSNDDLQHFAYAASHDLREPLRTVAVYSQILERHLQSNLDTESSTSLGAIKAAVGRMGQLIDGLLEYSTAGEGGPSSVEVDMELALTTALANLQGAIEENRAVITHDPLPCLRGNELHFVQLFQNVISNGLKYRGQDPPAIHLSAKRECGQWQFSIRDNGQGISPEYHVQIFELFKRLHGQDHSGSGIGLATCKRIVAKYDGRIWVESQPGEGATFFFTVPST
jgi:PAS domain S-box-containing protein